MRHTSEDDLEPRGQGQGDREGQMHCGHVSYSGFAILVFLLLKILNFLTPVELDVCTNLHILLKRWLLPNVI